MSEQTITSTTDNEQPKHTIGRPPVEIDLIEVERLAGLGMNQAQIAEGLGIGHSKWFKEKANNQDFADAYKRGQMKIRIKVLENLEKQAAKNFAVPMFLSKQQHILGFSDQAMNVQHGGKLELVVRHEIMGAGQEQEAIDITPKGTAGTVTGTKTIPGNSNSNDNNEMEG